MATAERRKGDRVTFERGFAAHMMGIDGTWRRACVMEDVSETGAKLTVEGSVEGCLLYTSRAGALQLARQRRRLLAA